MSGTTTQNRTVLPALLGAAVTDVVVDEALIRAERWSAVDLTALSVARESSGPLVGARFGGNDRIASPQVPAAAEDAPVNPRKDDLAAEERPFVDLLGPRRLARVTRVAPAQPEVTGGAGEPHPRPTGSFGTAPPRVQPMPAPRGVAWNRGPALTSKAILADKNNSKSLIVLMIALWVAITAIGVYKAVTPSSGFKIMWDDN